MLLRAPLQLNHPCWHPHLCPVLEPLHVPLLDGDVEEWVLHEPVLLYLQREHELVAREDGDSGILLKNLLGL